MFVQHFFDTYIPASSYAYPPSSSHATAGYVPPSAPTSYASVPSPASATTNYGLTISSYAPDPASFTSAGYSPANSDYASSDPGYASAPQDKSYGSYGSISSERSYGASMPSTQQFPAIFPRMIRAIDTGGGGDVLEVGTRWEDATAVGGQNDCAGLKLSRYFF